jgi:hypothetical protein
MPGDVIFDATHPSADWPGLERRMMAMGLLPYEPTLDEYLGIGGPTTEPSSQYGTTITVWGDAPKPTVSNDAGLREMHDWGMFMLFTGGEWFAKSPNRRTSNKFLYSSMVKHVPTWFEKQTKLFLRPGIALVNMYQDVNYVANDITHPGSGGYLEPTVSGVLAIAGAEAFSATATGLAVAGAEFTGAFAGGWAVGAFVRDKVMPDAANEWVGDMMLGIGHAFGYKE